MLRVLHAMSLKSLQRSQKPTQLLIYKHNALISCAFSCPNKSASGKSSQVIITQFLIVLLSIV